MVCDLASTRKPGVPQLPYRIHGGVSLVGGDNEALCEELAGEMRPFVKGQIGGKIKCDIMFFTTHIYIVAY